MTWSISVDHFSDEKVLEDDEEKMVLIVSSTLAATLYNKRERERERQSIPDIKGRRH